MAWNTYKWFQFYNIISLLIIITFLQLSFFLFMQIFYHNTSIFEGPNINFTSGTFILGIFILSFIIAWFFIRRLYEPIEQITNYIIHFLHNSAEKPIPISVFAEFSLFIEVVEKLCKETSSQKKTINELIESRIIKKEKEQNSIMKEDETEKVSILTDYKMYPQTSCSPLKEADIEQLVLIRSALDTVIGQFSQMIQEKDLLIVNAVPSDIMIWIDPDYLDILLENLIVMVFTCSQKHEKVLIKSSCIPHQQTIELVFIPESIVLVNDLNNQLQSVKGMGDETQLNRIMRLIRFITELHGGTFIIEIQGSETKIVVSLRYV